jgi:hypothetical protein
MLDGKESYPKHVSAGLAGVSELRGRNKFIRVPGYGALGFLSSLGNRVELV